MHAPSKRWRLGRVIGAFATTSVLHCSAIAAKKYPQDQWDACLPGSTAMRAVGDFPYPCQGDAVGVDRAHQVARCVVENPYSNHDATLSNV
ncbi:hypothetical protein [Xanthomonas euvesicatoria]|uniref:hypothetical protein n=1 Tax=Xanthomonas euvesicatoria TaxID=456327 RepID=UPI001C460D46|nr:hypothetical protein [Xanthomonas euvesicatoria]MBV6844963.1 hypothetical protein [Xanthomonas campestris pv. paulliniae]MBV6849473.1 hypothetical protein [Xanthomonas campestris pv. heliotropii]MCP3042671.1 hypothetical protein [Xanthomonas euvesicatoria pv. allii]